MAEKSNGVTACVTPDPSEVRAEMAETRSALTEKLETLEQRVKGTVEAAQHSVEETFENVKETVQETVQTVKRTFDIKHQVEQHPWAMLGTSVGAGFILGRLQPASTHRQAAPPMMHGNGVSSLSSLTSPVSHEASRRRKAAHRPGIKHKLLDHFGEEINMLEKAAVSGIMGLLRDWLKQSMPSISPQVEKVLDSATAKMGAEPAAPTSMSRERFSYREPY